MSDKTVEYDVTVVGLRFRWNAELRQQIAMLLNGAPMSMDVVREPNNEYDPFAIKIEAPVGSFSLNDKKKGERTGGHIGYLKADVAEILAPKLDEGTIEILSATLYELEAPDYNAGSITLVIKKLTT